MFKRKWPKPRCDESQLPHVLFILTPPYSGSTALAALLDSGPRTMILQERAEGQWLVPGLCDADRWDPGKSIDLTSIRRTWLARYQELRRDQPSIEIVIEKSPPNMMRFDALARSFPDHSGLVFNRDPFASCASVFHHHHRARALTLQERRDTFGMIASKWVDRSRQLRELIDRRSLPFLNYERFCESPSVLRPLLDLPDGVVESIDFGATVAVKGGAARPIANQNAERLVDLDPVDLEHLAGCLAPHQALLESFGYALPDPA